MMPATTFFTGQDRTAESSRCANAAVTTEHSGRFRVQLLRTCYIRGYPRGRKFPSRPKQLDGRPRSPAAKLRSSNGASPATTPRTPRSSSSIIVSCSASRRICSATAKKPSICRRRCSCGCSARCTASAGSRRCAPGSSGSSSIRCGTGSGGGGGVSGRIRCRSTSTSATTARWCSAPTRRHPTAS